MRLTPGRSIRGAAFSELDSSGDGMRIRPTIRPALVIAAALVAFYFPSSFGGAISRELTAASLLLTCGLLLAVGWTRSGLGPPVLVLNSLGIMGLLLLFTLTSTFGDYSPGAVFLYLAIALLYVVNVRSVRASGALEHVLLLINIVSVALGFAIVLDVRAVDRILFTYYAAFYPDLVFNMVTLHKPVLTFATHSMAGFMLYLLFYMASKAFEIRGARRDVAFGLLYIALMIFVRSTTGTVFAGIASLQLAWQVARRYRWAAVPLALAVVAVPLMLVLWHVASVAGVAALVQERILGDKTRGLIARYATGGLLAGNLDYMSQHPFSPVGLSFSQSLYYGDSGLIVNLLRGSLPLLVLVYGGLFLFLRFNLSSRRTAVWLYVVILAFEMGFTPLQYFRFVGFVPFMVAYLNSLASLPTAVDSSVAAAGARMCAHESNPNA